MGASEEPLVGELRLRISAVVPCHNEAEVLPELHRRLREVLELVAPGEWEIVIVNDGSTDGTWAAMRALAAADPGVVAVDLARQYGHQLALSSGLTFCRGELVFVLDADLQDPPELLPQMIELIDDGADVVYGRRIQREGETWFKRTTATLFYRFLSHVSDTSIPQDTGDFRLMTRRVVDVLNAMPEQHRFIRGMVAWVGFRQVPIEYERASRAAGSTKYPVRRMFGFALDALTSFSIAPLRISSILGVFVGALALLLLVYTIVSWLFLTAVAGWTSLMVVVLFLGAVQMVSFGVIGEYLGRLYIESKRRPLFVVKEVFVRESEVDDPVAATFGRRGAS